MPRAFVLAMKDLQAWSAKVAADPTPGGSLPYGLKHLQRDFDLAWSNSHRRGIWRTRPVRALGGLTRRKAPGLQGFSAALYAIPQMRHTDVLLSVFEDTGLGLARLQRYGVGLPHRVPHVMLTCWLAEDCTSMPRHQLRSVRSSIRSVSIVAVFSKNQVPILTDHFGLTPERISTVPFGIDTEYYSPTKVNGPSRGGGLLAVGGDSRRDYATLLDAVRIAAVPLTLVCYPLNIRGLKLPPQVQLLSGISHDEYRKLLHSADLIVTPTSAPAYPSGQSVVLEAMSMGKATLTTDSPAMRDYVTDGVDGVLVAPRDAEAMAKQIADLLGNPEARDALGAAAGVTVRTRFGLEHLWQAMSDLMLTATTSDAP